VKKIILTFDLDGPIGIINSTLPYNFGFNYILQEQKNVIEIIDILKQNKIKATFAITGFSAEKSVKHFELTNIIKKISEAGHEIASHSWKHENFSKITTDVAKKSLRRSKLVLNNEVVGFIPPHNRPMTWLKKCRISIREDRIFPFKKTGDISGIISILKSEGYKWIRISNNSIFKRMKFNSNITKIYFYNKILIIDGHYCGFDENIIDKIISSDSNQVFCISAHPAMFSFKNKNESKENFLFFIKKNE